MKQANLISGIESIFIDMVPALHFIFLYFEVYNLSPRQWHPYLNMTYVRKIAHSHRILIVSAFPRSKERKKEEGIGAGENTSIVYWMRPMQISPAE